jgi:hypothetical protein
MRGGIVTTWDETQLTLVSSHARTYLLTSVLSYAATNFELTLTNVYGPSDHDYTLDFLDELCSVASSVSGAWLLTGDFNLIWDPTKKNTENFDAPRTSAFNTAIHDMTLLELPLLDCSFTWSNQCECPMLARLDKAFLNPELDVIAANTTLTSLPPCHLGSYFSPHHHRHLHPCNSLLPLQKCVAPRSFLSPYASTGLASGNCVCKWWRYWGTHCMAQGQSSHH